MRVLVLVTSSWSVIAFAALGATPAIAGELPARPAFTMMDSTGDGSELVVELSTIFLPRDIDGEALHPRVLAQDVAASGLGGYAGLTASTLIGNDGSSHLSGTGNFELGGLFQHAINPAAEIGLRAGLILHTATNAGVPLNTLVTQGTRPGDVATALPGTWVRLGISPTVHTGSVFARIDVGVDIPVDSAGGYDPIGHINAGAGSGSGPWTLTAELGAIRALRGTGPDPLMIAGLAIRHHGESVSPYVMLSEAVDSALRGDFLTLTVGVAISP